jgi:phosphopantothenoylcysteine decarboxylase/phosphopantothenate--cysteine ligase
VQVLRQISADVFVATAAVADWRPATAADQKIKKDGSGETPALQFIENPDILATVAQSPRGQSGSAAENPTVFTVSASQLKATICWRMPAPSGRAKGCRCWWATSARRPSDKDDNALLLVDAQGASEVPHAGKLVLARQLMAEIGHRLNIGPAPTVEG